jgi:GNAT superfamily N-acetyltransferase
VDVTCTIECDLKPTEAAETILLQHLAYPDTPHFACRRWCHSPLEGDDLWFALRRDGRLLGSCRLLHRRIKAGEAELIVGGVGNVCSHPDARGIGAAKACMFAAADYMLQGGKVDFGMLFCGKHVVEFYRKLGWHRITNEVVRTPPPPAGREQVRGNVMICPGRMPLDQWPAGPVDLNGDDW